MKRTIELVDGEWIEESDNFFQSDEKQDELVYLQANVVNKREKYVDEGLAFKINKLLFESLIAKFYV